MQRSRVKVILVAVFAVVMFASASVDASSYGISKGDMLSIYVYRQEDMSVKVRVDNSGFIRFPLAGRINVVGKSPSQIEDIIELVEVEAN